MDPAAGLGPPSSPSQLPTNITSSQSLSMFPFNTNSQQLPNQISQNQTSFDNQDSFVNSSFLPSNHLPLHSDMQSSLLQTNFQHQSQQQQPQLQQTQSNLIGELEKAIATNTPKPSSQTNDHVDSQPSLSQALQFQQQISAWPQTSNPNLVNHSMSQQNIHQLTPQQQQHLQNLQRVQFQQQRQSQQLPKSQLAQQQLVQQQLYQQQQQQLHPAQLLHQHQLRQRQQQHQLQIRQRQLREEQLAQYRKVQFQREQQQRTQQAHQQRLQQSLGNRLQQHNVNPNQNDPSKSQIPPSRISAALLQHRQQNQPMSNVPSQPSMTHQLLNGDIPDFNTQQQLQAKKVNRGAPARRPRGPMLNNPGQPSDHQLNMHDLLTRQINNVPSGSEIIPGTTNAMNYQNIVSNTSSHQRSNNFSQAQLAQRISTSRGVPGSHMQLDQQSNPMNAFNRLQNQPNVRQQTNVHQQFVRTNNPSDPLSNESRFDPTKLEQLMRNTTDPKTKAALEKEFVFFAAAGKNEKLHASQISDQMNPSFNTSGSSMRSEPLSVSGRDNTFIQSMDGRKRNPQETGPSSSNIQGMRLPSVPTHPQPNTATQNHLQVQRPLPSNNPHFVPEHQSQSGKRKSMDSAPISFDGSRSLQEANNFPLESKDSVANSANNGNDNLEGTEEDITLELHIQKRKRVNQAPINDFQRIFTPDYSTPFSGRVDAWQRLLPYHVLYSKPDEEVLAEWVKGISELAARFKGSLHSLQEKWAILNETSCKPADSVDFEANNCSLTISDDIALNHVLIEEHYKSLREEAMLARKRAAEAAAKQAAEKKAAELSAMRAAYRAKQARAKEQGKAEQKGKSRGDNVQRTGSQNDLKTLSRTGSKGAKRSPRDSPKSSSRHGTELSTGSRTNYQSLERRSNAQVSNITGTNTNELRRSQDQISLMNSSSGMNARYSGMQSYQGDDARISSLNAVLGGPQLQQKEKDQFSQGQEQFKPYFQQVQRGSMPLSGQGDLLASHLQRGNMSQQGGFSHHLLDPSKTSQSMSLQDSASRGHSGIATSDRESGVGGSNNILKNGMGIERSDDISRNEDDRDHISNAHSMNGHLGWGPNLGTENNNALTGITQQASEHETGNESGT